MTSPPRLWDGVLRRLGAEMAPFALTAWIEPIEPHVEDDCVRLLCPTAFHRDRVRERFLGRIARCLEAELGRAFEVEAVVDPQPRRPRTDRPAQEESPAATAEAPARVARTARPPAQEPLPYRFDNFVVGPCNALAREAAVAVAEGRQRRLDPLYLASPAGLGKTHLARAIVGEARSREVRRVLYASAETFTNDFMTSIRARRMDDFKRRYRSACDLMVLEDVQFLRAKKATQLELFHTLLHMMDAGTRVVLTGDRVPREIEALEPRLCSQLAAGLVAELDPPDARLRREILRSKAASGGVRLPDDCLELLTDRVRGSVRDLESVLIQLVTSASLLKRPIDLPLTRAALQKVAPGIEGAAGLTPAEVIGAVAAFFGTRPEQLASRSRRRDVLLPRQLAMYLCRRYTDASLAEIGRALGRDHPAVGNAVKAVERQMLERAPLRYRVEALCERLESLEREKRR